MTSYMLRPLLKRFGVKARTKFAPGASNNEPIQRPTAFHRR